MSSTFKSYLKDVMHIETYFHFGNKDDDTTMVVSLNEGENCNLDRQQNQCCQLCLLHEKPLSVGQIVKSK